MAQAKSDTRKVKKTIEVDEEVITLELTRDEAEAVQALLSRTNSVNQEHTYKVWDSLRDLGINGEGWTIINVLTGQPTPTLRLTPEP
jgi:hypothetical protein